MSEEVQSLVVPVDEMVDATKPLVVISAELLTNINTLSQQAANLSVIGSDAENEVAANLLKVVTGLEKEVDDCATKCNAPFHAISKAISNEKAKAAKPLATIKANLKLSLSNYIIKREKERMAAEQEAARKRAEEAAAAEAKRKAEQAELDALNKSRAEAAVAAGAEAPAPLTLAPAAPAPSEVIVAKPGQAKADAVKVARKQVVVLVDPDKVPRSYCIPDLKLIEAAWKRGEITPEFHPFFRVEEQVNVSAK
jgi:hypothetical protein